MYLFHQESGSFSKNQKQCLKLLECGTKLKNQGIKQEGFKEFS